MPSLSSFMYPSYVKGEGTKAELRRRREEAMLSSALDASVSPPTASVSARSSIASNASEEDEQRTSSVVLNETSAELPRGYRRRRRNGIDLGLSSSLAELGF